MARSDRRSSFRDAAAVVAAKALVSSLVLAGGFRALSDDDYARIVIAQRFAESPSLDPSGTSWLPFPFWLNGGAMLLLGPSVETAQVVAFALGLGSALAVWVALRWLGAGRPGALLGALLASVFPYSAWLGVAAVPELPSAALCLLGMASLARGGRARLAGAVALSAAGLSRYEAWPMAAVFALFCLRDAWRDRTAARLGPALIAAAGPVAWLLHGAFRHGSALFFVKRVSEYRRAVGAGSSDAWQALLGFPSMLARCEPELFAFALVALAAALALGARAVLARHARVLVALAAVLAFLVVGDLRDGAPTHHGERALLALWLGLAALGGDALAEAWRRARGPARAALVALPGLMIAPMAGVVRPWYGQRDAFIDRSAELAMGRVAARAAAPSGRLLIDSEDFGFYAVMAGFAAPSRSEPVDDRDPRRPRVDAPSNPAALRARLEESRADWLVVGAARRALAERLGVLERDGGQLLLVRLTPAKR